MLKRKSIEALAVLLEEAGYKGALALIEGELIKTAIKNKVSLHKAMNDYAAMSSIQEQDTSYYQLHMALTKIEVSNIDNLEIDMIVTKRPL